MNLFQKILFRLFEKRYPQLYLRKYLKKNKPEILHIHMVSLLRYFPEQTLNDSIRVKMVTLHSNPINLNNKYMKIVQNAFSKNNFIPICLNEQQALLGKKYFKFDNYEILHNGIDFNYIDSKIVSKEEARKKLGLDINYYIIGNVGRLATVKNQELLINSFAKICQKSNKYRLIFAGDGNLYGKLKCQVDNLGISDKVVFLGNIEDVITLYCALDVFALPSYSEASPLVLLEAQKCGDYCVISDGVPDESIITSNVVKMKKNATIDEWGLALINQNMKKAKKMFDFADYDIDVCLKRNIDLYLKYFNFYN